MLTITITIEPHGDGWLASLLDEAVHPDDMPLAEATGDTPDAAVAALVASVSFDDEAARRAR